MKFKNPSLNFFERTDERTHARTHKPKAICFPLFQSWGHNDVKSLSFAVDLVASHDALPQISSGGFRQSLPNCNTARCICIKP